MRKEKSIKNFLTSIIPYVLLLLLGFVRVDIFVDKLGDEIYALNQLFYQLFIYISLAEAGAGTYIVQMYYKYFANNDREQIVNVYNGAKRLLKKIAAIVLITGFAISFTLKLFTNNNLSILYMQFVFMLFLLKNIIEYLMMAPKSVIEADQKLYKINVRYYGMRIFEMLVDIILLYFGVNYIFILIGEIIVKFLTYFVTNKKIFKEYPWLTEKPKDNSLKIKGVSNMLWHRVSEAIHYNTDIIITSSFLTPLLVTIYSSYNYIIKYLTDTTDMISGSMSASFGNVVYKEKTNNVIRILEELNIMFLFFASFLSIMVYTLSTPFVTLWLGKKYLMNNISLVFLVINLFIVVARKPLNMFRNSNGLFKETKVIVLIEALVNLVLSLVLVKWYGLTGILFATTISMLVTTFWYMPYFIYKKKLNIKYYPYFIRYIFVSLVTVFLMFVSRYLISLFKITNMFNWLVVSIIVGSIVLLILLIIFYSFSKDFRKLKDKVIDIFKKRCK